MNPALLPPLSAREGRLKEARKAWQQTLNLTFWRTVPQITLRVAPFMACLFVAALLAELSPLAVARLLTLTLVGCAIASLVTAFSKMPPRPTIASLQYEEELAKLRHIEELQERRRKPVFIESTQS